jgi:hypothetical protein
MTGPSKWQRATPPSGPKSRRFGVGYVVACLALYALAMAGVRFLRPRDRRRRRMAHHRRHVHRGPLVRAPLSEKSPPTSRLRKMILLRTCRLTFPTCMPRRSPISPPTGL